MVDPYHAVTDQLDPRTPAALPAYVPKPPDRAALAASAETRQVDAIAKWSATGALGGLLLAGAAAVVLRRARRRDWRPASAPRLPAEPEVTEPPEQIFLLER